MSVSSRSFDGVRRGSGRVRGLQVSPDQGLYPISVAAELTGVEAHTLRGYERAGLLTPARSRGGSRRYSDNDLSRLRRIWSLSADRVNLEGIRRILLLEQEVAALRAEIDRLRNEADANEPPPGG